jgi:pimeloyl-ACP methyl ester carboxylesterase
MNRDHGLTRARPAGRALAGLALAWLAFAGLALAAPVRAIEDTLHVAVTGSGPAVVILPGLAGGGYAFRHIVPLLRDEGYTVVVIEPLGVGASGRPREADYSLGAQTARIERAIDSLRLRDAIVVGHARGGSIAMRLAWRRPDLVRAILSVEGGPAESAAGAGLRRAMRFAALIKIFGTRNGLRHRIREQMLGASGDRSWVNDETVEGYAAPAMGDFKRTVDILKATSKSHEPDSLRPHLAQISCCVELLLGDAPHDGALDADQITILQHALPCFSLTRVPGAGHFIQEEQPAAILAAVARLNRFTAEEREARGAAIPPPLVPAAR